MNDPISFLSSILALAGLWVIFDAGYRSYRVNLLRNRLFELRSELFEYARSGALGERGFDDPAYRHTRRILNGYIRFAHQLTLFRMFVLLWSSRWWLDDERCRRDMQEFLRTLTDLRPLARGRLFHVLKEAELAIVMHMVFVNIFGLSVLKPVEWSVRLAHRQKKFRANLAREVNRRREMLVPLEQETFQRLQHLEQRRAA